jgi:hypothetical protein
MAPPINHNNINVHKFTNKNDEKIDLTKNIKSDTPKRININRNYYKYIEKNSSLKFDVFFEVKILLATRNDTFLKLDDSWSNIWRQLGAQKAQELENYVNATINKILLKYCLFNEYYLDMKQANLKPLSGFYDSKNELLKYIKLAGKEIEREILYGKSNLNKITSIIDNTVEIIVPNYRKESYYNNINKIVMHEKDIIDSEERMINSKRKCNDKDKIIEELVDLNKIINNLQQKTNYLNEKYFLQKRR